MHNIMDSFTNGFEPTNNCHRYYVPFATTNKGTNPNTYYTCVLCPMHKFIVIGECNTTCIGTLVVVFLHLSIHNHSPEIFCCQIDIHILL